MAIMRLPRLLFRVVFAVLYTAYIVGLTLLRNWLLKTGQADAQRIRQRWARTLLHTLGIRVETEGNPPNFPCILMSNHRSYIDPIVILREVQGVPVSKAEVSKWPILGRGAQLAGILYLKREHGGSRTAMLRSIAETVQKDGWPIILFPEGTTSDLEGTLPFKPGSFQLAARLGIPVVPVAITFKDKADYWVGKSTFGAHAWERFQQRRIYIHIAYGPVIDTTDAIDLSTETYNWINTSLQSLQQQHTA
jgi:lyso-ornithine lipid O-acyltransferase